MCKDEIWWADLPQPIGSKYLSDKEVQKMIEQVELYNFKSHRSTKLNFDGSGLHALVGQNSSGKTSVLQALHCLCQLTTSQFKDVFQYQQFPKFIITTGQDNMSVVVSGSKGYSTRERWTAGYKFKYDFPLDESTVLWQINQQESIEEGDDSSLMKAAIICWALKSNVYLKLDATNLAKADYSEAIIPRVKFDGSGLAPTLDYLRGEVPDGFQSLQEMLQRIVPGVQKVGVRRAKVKIDRQRLIEVDGKSISYEENQEVAGQEIVLDMNTGERIPAHAISEGTMIMLGLLTVLINPYKPNLVLLDDIEQGLHPNAQRELINVLKDIIQANQDLQIIFSTHSPYIVDELAPSQVHVLSNSNGFTHSKRLDEHPDVEWAKQTLTTGEFWDAEGEDWVIDGEVDA
jgi:predicted ATPase